jgi:hypothetical protein
VRAVGRITRHPPKPKPKYVHAVNVDIWEAEDPWIWDEVKRIGGLLGYRTRKPNWGCRVLAFDTPEKEQQMRRLLARWRHERYLLELRRQPCRIATAYERAALGQHAVLWGLSTGVIADVVAAYREAWRGCSAHGPANWEAVEAIDRRFPHLTATPAGFDRAREMIDFMLVYAEARDRDGFWCGLEGEHTLYAFAFHR